MTTGVKSLLQDVQMDSTLAQHNGVLVVETKKLLHIAAPRKFQKMFGKIDAVFEVALNICIQELFTDLGEKKDPPLLVEDRAIKELAFKRQKLRALRREFPRWPRPQTA